MRKQVFASLMIAACLWMPHAWADEKVDVSVISKALLNLNNRITALERQQGKTAKASQTSGGGNNMDGNLQQVQNSLNTLQQQINALQQQIKANQNDITTLQGKMRFLDTDR